MLLQYKGDGKRVSFIPNKFYEVRKIHDDLGDGYAIFDEGDDWYRYGVKYVEKNFDTSILENEVEFNTAESVAV